MYFGWAFYALATCIVVYSHTPTQHLTRTHNSENITGDSSQEMHSTRHVQHVLHYNQSRSRNVALFSTFRSSLSLFTRFLKSPIKFLRNRNRSVVGRHECVRYKGWKATTVHWDDKLRPMSMLLCLVNTSGTKGNCLYDSIANAYNMSQLKIENLQFNHDLHSNSLFLSIHNLEPRRGKITNEFLRKLVTIHFLGVNPYDSVALDAWDRHAFEEKLEFFANAVDAGGFNDVHWKPREKLESLKRRPNDVRILKSLYDELKNTQNVVAWGGYDELVALSHILNIDFLIFHNDEPRIQQVSYDPQIIGARPVLLLYYYHMLHFCNAGLVDKSKTDEIRTYITPEHYPLRLNNLII